MNFIVLCNLNKSVMKNINLELKMGFLISLLLGAYFLIMEIFGLSDVIYLKFVNIIIIIWVLNRTIKRNIENGKTTYLGNFGSGLITAFYGILFSILGLWIYVGVFRGSDYIDHLAASVIIGGGEVTLPQFCLALLFEGLSSSFVLVFILMQKWKNVKNLNSKIEIKQAP